jgi:hypothetical protein
MAIDNDNIPIYTTTEMEKYKPLRYREFVHTHVYDVNLRELVWTRSFPPFSGP